MERVRFETHAGQRVLVIDCSNVSARDLIDVFDQVREIVTAQPEASVLTLTDFTGAQFDKRAADYLKIVAVYDRPHVKRAALVGAETLPEVYYRNLMSFSVRDFPVFASREAALAYLTADEAVAKQSA